MDDEGKFFFFAPHVHLASGDQDFLLDPCVCNAIVCAVHDAYVFFSKAYVCAFAKGAKNSESQMARDSVRKKEGQPTFFFHFIFFYSHNASHLVIRGKWISSSLQILSYSRRILIIK